MGFRAWGLGLRFRLWDLGFGIWWFRVWDLWVRFWDLAVQGLGFKVYACMHCGLSRSRVGRMTKSFHSPGSPT